MNDLPDPWSELGEFIREQREVARLSLRRLSDLAGVSNPYLSQIERGLRRPSAEILQQIAKALRISAETLYVRAGILDARSSDGDLADAIMAEPTLTDAQKQTLLHIYLSFRREQDAASTAAAPPPPTGPAPAGAEPVAEAPPPEDPARRRRSKAAAPLAGDGHDRS